MAISSRAKAAETRVFLELDLYSGRPNPGLQLGPEVAAEINRRISTLPEAEKFSAEPPALGYRGVLVRRNVESEVAYRVFGGEVVALEAEGAGRVFMDRNRAFERWLMDLVARQASDDEVRAIAQALRDGFNRTSPSTDK